ncbi:MAG: hypothetical protein ACM3JK_06490 [Betaproteobacteria bacterium]
MNPASLPESPDEFRRQLNGLLFSLLSWQQLTDFWSKIDRTAGWYLYAIGEPLPLSPASAAQVEKFVVEIDALLRDSHRESYCGIVYANDVEHPRFVKIYDPDHLGSSCGSASNPTLPGWVMSLTPPSELKPRYVVPANRRRWWQSLFPEGQ